jgi:bacterioferritin-associated ferredoxin
MNEDLDREICLCFHVSRRKVVNFLRVEKPKRAGQLSECHGAGTGCGWCRPFLKQLFEEAVSNGATTAHLPSPEEYARLRSRYVRAGGGTPPPGATPIQDDEEEGRRMEGDDE